MKSPNIYAYVKEEESNFESDEIRMGDNWTWNFRKHVQLIFHLKNGVFYTGENNWLRAFKNIMEPMLNLAYWTEDLEVKDVTFFIESATGRVLSFFIKKYHDEVYVREHDLDTLFDEITESDLDYGGVIVQKTKNGRPEVIPLNTIAFCDQTDTLGGVIAFKHHFSPSALRRMEKAGWGAKENGATISINELITLADQTKDPLGLNDTRKNRVPSKTVEVYIIRGDMPRHYLDDSNNMEESVRQVHVIAYYTKKDSTREGVTLYRREEVEETIKFFTSKKVAGRALGRGVGESLLHPQIWTNFLTIHKFNLLESASKVPLFTDDPNYKNRNRIQDMENLEITVVEDGKSINQVPTAAPANIAVFENAINDLYQHAQLASSAFDSIMGKEESAGTTFKGQERLVQQGRGLHDRRRGQRAKFIEEIYRDWIIPDIVKEITKGKTFLATLSADELAWVSDQLATNYANKRMVELFLDDKEVSPELHREAINFFKENFAKAGNRKLINILKGEFTDVAVRMGINIAGKQKDLSMLSDKMLSIFQFIFANPVGFQQAMQIPALAKGFHDILEFSGISQADFLSLTQQIKPDMMQMQPPQPLSTPTV